VRSVVVEQAIAAPVSRIWRACAQVEGLRAWQADEVSGTVRVGEQLVFGWPSLGVSVELDVEIIEGERRIAFRSDEARLEISITPGQVTLTHTADFDEDECEGTRSSWRLALATLAHYLEHHDGRPRTVHWAVQRSATTIDDAHAFFTLPEAQRGWLTRAGTGVGEEGSEIALDLAWGRPLTGRVLSHTPPRDVLLSWRETNHSLLALRTLPSPDTDGERLLVATWSNWGTIPNADTAAQLDGAMNRLSRVLQKRATA